MSKISKTGIFVLIAILLVALPLAGCKATPSGPQTGVVKIGIITDLTGPAAASSVPMGESMEDWTKYVNANLNGVAGHQVELVAFDARYDNNLAVSGVEKLINQDKVQMIWFSAGNYYPATKPLLDKYHMPGAGPTEMAVLLPHTPDSFLFGIIPQYADMFRCSLTWMKDNWKKKEAPRIGLMGLDMAFSKSTIKPVKWMLENELKWPIVAEEWMTMSATDVTSQVTNLKNAKCDYVLMPLTGSGQFLFQKTAKAAGLTDSTQLVDIFINMMMTFRKLDPAATTGLISHSPCVVLEMKDEVKMVAQISDIHTQSRPSAPPLDWIRITSYGATILMDEVLEKTIAKYGYDNLTGDNIKWIMEHEMKGYDSNGLIGPIPWSTETHAGPHDVIIVKTLPDFKLEILKKWQEMPPWPKEANSVDFWKP